MTNEADVALLKNAKQYSSTEPTQISAPTRILVRTKPEKNGQQTPHTDWTLGLLMIKPADINTAETQPHPKLFHEQQKHAQQTKTGLNMTRNMSCSYKQTQQKRQTEASLLIIYGVFSLQLPTRDELNFATRTACLHD